MGVKGYKVFNPDWTCRDFQYEIGKTYEHKGEIEVCKEGFHFCRKLNSCFGYYEFDIVNKVAEVEAIGKIKTERDKSVTDKIVIKRELSWNEVLDLVNIGSNNNGSYNTGNHNAGNYNTGKYNVGMYNVGNYNTGSKNVGYFNIGVFNTGDNNIGDYNTGDFNIGDFNTGDFNLGQSNCGIFNTTNSKIQIFNKPSDWTYDDWLNSDAYDILKENNRLTKWIFSDFMNEEEKEMHPEHETLGGYLKEYTYEEMWQNTWKILTEEEKELVMQLPNFDKDIFKEITGIDIEED